MTTVQKVIKYLAIALAALLAISIVSGVLGAVGLFSGLFEDDAVADEVQQYPVSGEITELAIEIGAADLYIKEGEAFSVESNLKRLKVSSKSGRLLIKEVQRPFSTYEDAVLTVCVPKGTVFHSVSLSTGAGRLTVEELSAEVVDFDFGAGEVSIGTLTAKRSADIDGGAGRVTIQDGTLTGLDLDMGVGRLDLTTALRGECQMDLGVGKSNITLLGSKDDYRVEIERGVGSVTVDGKEVSDYGNSGSGANEIEINGGVGAINVTFMEKTEK